MTINRKGDKLGQHMGRANGPRNIFRSKGKKYYAQLISHYKEGDAFTSPDGTWHQGLAMFVIRDELQEDELGGVMFTAGPLVKATWNNFDNTSKEYFETVDHATAILVNLLNYLPLDLSKIPEWFHGRCFEFRFDNQADEGLDPTRPIFNISARDGIQKNIRRWVLGENFETKDALEAMKKILWNTYELNPDVGITFNLFAKMLGLSENVVKGYMRRLVDGQLATISSGTDQERIISIKAKYELVEQMEGGGVKKTMTQDNRKYVTNISGGIHGSAVTINSQGDVHQEFISVTKLVDEIDDLKQTQKDEVKELVQQLDAEMADKKDENKIVGLIKKIAGLSAKVFQNLTTNPTIGPFISYYLAKASGIDLP